MRTIDRIGEGPKAGSVGSNVFFQSLAVNRMVESDGEGFSSGIVD